MDKVYNAVSRIEITDASTIVNPITTVIKPVTPNKSYLNFFLEDIGCDKKYGQSDKTDNCKLPVSIEHKTNNEEKL